MPGEKFILAHVLDLQWSREHLQEGWNMHLWDDKPVTPSSLRDVSAGNTARDAVNGLELNMLIMDTLGNPTKPYQKKKEKKKRNLYNHCNGPKDTKNQQESNFHIHAVSALPLHFATEHLKGQIKRLCLQCKSQWLENMLHSNLPAPSGASFELPCHADCNAIYTAGQAHRWPKRGRQVVAC